MCISGMEFRNTLCPISYNESMGVQTSSATWHPFTSTMTHKLYTMSWNIYICVHFTSTINISIFSSFWRGESISQGISQSCTCPYQTWVTFWMHQIQTALNQAWAWDLSYCCFLFLRGENEVWKKDKQEHLVHSFFTDYATIQFSFCVFLYHPRNHAAFISTCLYPTRTHVLLGRDQVGSSGLTRNENFKQKCRRSLLQITVWVTTS